MKLALVLSLIAGAVFAQTALREDSKAIPPKNTAYVPTCKDYRLWYEEGKQREYDAVRKSYRFSDLQITTYPDRKLLTPNELMDLLTLHRKELGIDDVSIIAGGTNRLPLDELLYPQNFNNFTLSETDWRELQRRAKANLKISAYAHPDVIAHWKSIADGRPPFGLKVRLNQPPF